MMVTGLVMTMVELRVKLPSGRNTTPPALTCASACWNAKVSSFTPSPTAPNFFTYVLDVFSSMARAGPVMESDVARAATAKVNVLMDFLFEKQIELEWMG